MLTGLWTGTCRILDVDILAATSDYISTSNALGGCATSFVLIGISWLHSVLTRRISPVYETDGACRRLSRRIDLFHGVQLTTTSQWIMHNNWVDIYANIYRKVSAGRDHRDDWEMYQSKIYVSHYEALGLLSPYFLTLMRRTPSQGITTERRTSGSQRRLIYVEGLQVLTWEWRTVIITSFLDTERVVVSNCPRGYEWCTSARIHILHTATETFPVGRQDVWLCWLSSL